MKICIATPLYPPELGGPATYSKLLEEGLPAEGIKVELVKWGNVRHLPTGIRHVVYFWNVYRTARGGGLVLALDPVSVGFPALMAARLAGVPFLVKIVGDFAWEQGTQRHGITESLDQFVRKGRVPFRVALLRTIQTHVAKSARAIIVPSHYLKGIISHWGVAPEKIEVIYNAIAEDHGVGTLLEEVLHASRPRIITIGRLVPWKGMEEVIRAYAKLRVEIPAAELFIAGEGPERAALEAVAAQENVPVHFLGALSHVQVLALLTDCDLFILNSTYEGLSHVLIEALSQGTLCVASDAGGNPELIKNGENGYLVPVGDMERLEQTMHIALTDTERAARLRTRARESAARFTRDRMLTATAHYLRSHAAR